jgi:hypothetical protein
MPTREELAKMHWRDRYEYEAKREAENLGKQTEQELLKRIQTGNLGSYFQIWYEIGKKGTLKDSAMVLLEFLQQHPGDNSMHHRYHCSAALLRIVYGTNTVGDDELRKQIQWDHAGEEMRQLKLLELREIILSKQKNGY